MPKESTTTPEVTLVGSIAIVILTAAEVPSGGWMIIEYTMVGAGLLAAVREIISMTAEADSWGFFKAPKLFNTLIIKDR